MPRFNIAPTQPIPIIRQNKTEPVRELSLMRWGLIPSWAKDASGAARMINARGESASEKPAFRDAMKYRRCLIPADGFYEWQKTSAGKQPYCFEVDRGKLFAFAGLWDCWRGAKGESIESSSILTTAANSTVAPIHDRMPVILHSEDYDLWLDPGMKDSEVVSQLIKPYEARLMRAFPVSPRINRPENDDPECAQPAELQELQKSLFA